VSTKPIPYGRHWIDHEDVDAVVRVLRHGDLTQGSEVEAFEREVAELCGAKHAVAVSSGTSALQIALLASGIHEGDEVVGPAVSFLSTTNCGLHVGARPVFTDVSPHGCRMTAETLAPVLGPRTRAVLPVHFAGYPCDMPAIADLVRSECPDAVLVEDACHALGGSHADGTPVGSLRWADMVMFSFHPAKHIATGEGGMILTDREDLDDRLRLLRSHGTTRDPSRLTRPQEGPWQYEMLTLGFNFRMPDLNAALGRSQLKKLELFLSRRRAIAARYHRELGGLPHTTMPDPVRTTRSAWHLYVLRIDFEALGTGRAEVVEALEQRGIGTALHYPMIPDQPYYRERFGDPAGRFPAAARHQAEALTIPLFPGMSDDDVARVVTGLHEVLEACATAGD
jgi:UDP-4-amino-4,6-dideoxy-N-acetyl-beta-L-altrosamine transaminase